jgi:hypothetical protein
MFGAKTIAANNFVTFRAREELSLVLVQGCFTDVAAAGLWSHVIGRSLNKKKK